MYTIEWGCKSGSGCKKRVLFDNSWFCLVCKGDKSQIPNPDPVYYTISVYNLDPGARKGYFYNNGCFWCVRLNRSKIRIQSTCIQLNADQNADPGYTKRVLFDNRWFSLVCRVEQIQNPDPVYHIIFVTNKKRVLFYNGWLSLVYMVEQYAKVGLGSTSTPIFVTIQRQIMKI